MKQPTKEWALVAIVSLISIAANLPESLMVSWGIKRDYLVIALAAVVTVALLRYLKFTLFLVVTVLAVGANLPVDLAERVGVSPFIMLLAMGTLVLISFVNYVLKVLPSGLEPKAAGQGEEAVKALFAALEKGDARRLQQVLDMGVDPNLRDATGEPALMRAVHSGDPALVQVLVKRGADLAASNTAGDTAQDLAARLGRADLAKILYFMKKETA